VIFVVFVCCSKHGSTKPGRNQPVPPTIALVSLRLIVPAVKVLDGDCMRVLLLQDPILLIHGDLLRQ
jgi:hypothetical protein